MTKAVSERRYLQAFATALRNFPAGALFKSENPDFLLHVADGVLGIELTRIFRPAPAGTSPAREQESLRERVVAMARDRFAEAAMPPAYVSLHFNELVPLRKRDVPHLAKMLVELASRLMPAPGGSREEEFTWWNRSYFPESMAFMRVSRLRHVQRPVWIAPSAGYVSQLSVDDVRVKIAEKDLRIPDYLSQCKRVWLVLCVGGEGLSSYAECAEDALLARYETDFERVFIYGWPSTVHELRTSTKGARP